MLARVASRVSDRAMLKLLGSWLGVGVLEGGVTTDSGAGTPQGSPISPLLANIALHVLDAARRDHGQRLGVLISTPMTSRRSAPFSSALSRRGS